MILNGNLGDTFVIDLIGHSATNGAPLPSSITLATSNAAVATLPATVTPDAADATKATGIPVTTVGAGSTDFTADGSITAPDGTTQAFHASGTLVLSVPTPGLVSIEMVIRKV